MPKLFGKMPIMVMEWRLLDEDSKCPSFSGKCQSGNGVENAGQVFKMPKLFGKIPIMVGSKACHLRELGNESNKLLSSFL